MDDLLKAHFLEPKFNSFSVHPPGPVIDQREKFFFCHLNDTIVGNEVAPSACDKLELCTRRRWSLS
jgi:hypothetical protein